MPRCNTKRCGFLGNSCIGCLSDCYCKSRMTPKQCGKRMKELEITDIIELLKIIREDC